MRKVLAVDDRVQPEIGVADGVFDGLDHRLSHTDTPSMRRLGHRDVGDWFSGIREP